jgi:glutamate dehydrogenase (NADP+)
MESKIKGFMDLVKQRNQHEPEFLQAVEEVAETVIPYIASNEIYNGKNILLRMVEPETVITLFFKESPLVSSILCAKYTVP